MEKGVSIIIPCYNREETIKECINSIISQDLYRNFEILVCDDGSTDNSMSVVKAMNLPQVKVLLKPKEETKKGASIARNRGIKAAKYEYVCFLDSDDWYLPNYLNTATKYLDEHSDIGYVFCRSKKAIIENGHLIYKDWTRKKLTYIDRRYHVLFRGFNINTNVIIVRNSVLKNVGLFDTSLEVGEDSDMWIRISDISRGEFLNIYGAAYRISYSDNQLTKSSLKKKSCSIKLNLKNIERQLSKSHPDKMSLYLSARTLLFITSNLRCNVMLRLKVALYSLILFPLQYTKFLYHVLF